MWLGARGQPGGYSASCPQPVGPSSAGLLQLTFRLGARWHPSVSSTASLISQASAAPVPGSCARARAGFAGFRAVARAGRVGVWYMGFGTCAATQQSVQADPASLCLVSPEVLVLLPLPVVAAAGRLNAGVRPLIGSFGTWKSSKPKRSRKPFLSRT